MVVEARLALRISQSMAQRAEQAVDYDSLLVSFDAMAVSGAQTGYSPDKSVSYTDERLSCWKLIEASAAKAHLSFSRVCLSR